MKRRKAPVPTGAAPRPAAGRVRRRTTIHARRPPLITQRHRRRAFSSMLPDRRPRASKPARKDPAAAEDRPMKNGARRLNAGALLLLAPAALASSIAAAGREVQLTIYNSDFALVKETRALALKQGVNEARFTDVTSLVEPDSVVLRDRKDADAVRILEQDYEADPLSEGALLRRYEGKTIPFRTI